MRACRNYAIYCESLGWFTGFFEVDEHGDIVGINNDRWSLRMSDAWPMDEDLATRIVHLFNRAMKDEVDPMRYEAVKLDGMN